jgi:hypothetical protein
MSRACRMARPLRVALLLAPFATATVKTADAKGAHPWLRIQESLTTTEGIPLQTLKLTSDREAALTKDGYGYVDLLSRDELHLGSDGIIRDRITIVRRFLSSSGADSGGNMTMVVNPAYEDAPVVAAYVHAPDGRVVGADPATVQVANYPQPSLFSDAFLVTVPFREIVPGTIAVLVFETRFRSNEWPLPWSAVLPLQMMVPIENREVVVEWDDQAGAPAWQSDDPALTCRSESAYRLRCLRTNIDAFALDPQLSSVYDLMPQLVLGRSSSWNDLAVNLGRLIDNQIGSAPELTALAHKLSAQRTPREALSAIDRFVADDVRYVALEQGDLRVVPHPPQLTLERRFGDCKDKVTLFLALARLAGFKAHAALVAIDRYRLPKLIAPSASYFNHMIACVDQSDGETTCMDLTMPGASLGELPPRVEGAVALDLTSDTQTPRALPQSRYARRIEITSTDAIHCDGSIHERVERRMFGPGALLVRRALLEIVAGNRTRWFEEEFHRVVRQDVTPTVTFEGLLNSGRPLTIVAQADFPISQPMAGRKGFVDWDAWLIDTGRSIRSQNRHHPYRHDGLHLTSRIEYDVCPDVEISATGAELDLHSRFGNLTRTYERTASHIHVDTTLDVPRVEVSGAQLQSFNLFLTQALGQSRIWFGLRPPRH